MLTLSVSTRIFICTERIDMRKSFDGLIGVVRNRLECDPLAGDWFVFLNRNGDRVKILYWDGDGFAIWYKRLERGTFRIPAGNGISMTMTRAELTMILEGIDPVKTVLRRRYHRAA